MAAEDLVNQTFDEAVGMMDAAANVADTLTSLIVNPSFAFNLLEKAGVDTQIATHNVTYAADAPPAIAPQSVNVSVPAYDISWVNGVSSFGEFVVPDFTEVAPEINMPASVTLDSVTAPNTRPTLEQVDTPDAPTYKLPTLPSIQNIVVPDDVNVEMPVFNSTFTLNQPIAPTNQYTFTEQVYSSQLLNAALDLLQEDIENGGYGLRPEDELNLWNRAKARINKTVEQELDEAEGNIASRGFTLPTGAQNALIAKASQNKTAELAKVNNELAIKRADMYVQARQFAITTGLSAQQFLINFHNAVQERALNHNKYMADIAVTYFNAEVQAFNAGLEKFKTDAEVYRTRLQGAREQTEIYRSRLEAARLKGQINQDAIELYLAQFKGVEALINIYNTQLQSARVKAELQELKFRVYGEDIRAYIAQLDANSKRIEQYTALVGAEQSKLNLYKTQIDAHNTKLGTVKLRADINSTKINSEIETAGLKLRGFSTQLDRFNNEYTQAMANAKLVLEKGGIDINAWEAKSRIGLGVATLSHDAHRTNTGNLKDMVKLRLDRWRAEIDATLQNTKMVLDQYQGGADVYSRLSAAAFSAVNTIAAIIE